MFLHNWSNLEDMKRDFWPYDNYQEDMKRDLEGVTILLATYGYGDYVGDAFVLFERGGKLYEVNGGHCSCMGLEGQWEPEETAIEALMHRMDKGSLGRDVYEDYSFEKELREVCESLMRK